MKYLCFATVIVFMLSTAAVAAEEARGTGAAAGKGQVTVQGKEKEIETDYNDESSGGKARGAGDKREMPASDSYDPNTGLPNVVSSDKEGELE